MDDELLAIAERENVALATLTEAIAEYYVNAIRLLAGSRLQHRVHGAEPRPLRRGGRPIRRRPRRVSLALALLLPAGGQDYVRAVSELEASLAGFREIDHAWGQAMALVMLGRIDMPRHPPARERFDESLALAAQGERLGIVIARNHRGLGAGSRRRCGGRDSGFRGGHGHRARDPPRREPGIRAGAYVGLRAAQLDARGAGLLLGAAQSLRRRKGSLNPGASSSS